MFKLNIFTKAHLIVVLLLLIIPIRVVHSVPLALRDQSVLRNILVRKSNIIRIIRMANESVKRFSFVLIEVVCS